MNKGRICREIREFSRYSSSLIKSDDELRWEIRNFSKFVKKTQRRVHGIKNCSIWIIILGEIKEKNQEREIDHEERENSKIS